MHSVTLPGTLGSVARRPAFRGTVLASALVVVLAGVAAPAVGGDERGPLGFTIYEISDRIAITDETPLGITLTPGGPPVQEPLENPLPGAAGVGDEIITDSTLFARVNDVFVPQLPPVLPVAADPAEIPLPWKTFAPAGPPIGDSFGVCTFVLSEIDLDAGVDDRRASCELTFSLDGRGDITAGGILDVSALEGGQPTTLAITGGTDRFRRARGTVTLQQPSVPAFDRFVVTVDYRL